MAERVVSDTNIWISGLMWRGKPYQCMLLARAGIVQALHCREIVAELTHELTQVFGSSENHIDFDSECRVLRLRGVVPVGTHHFHGSSGL